MLDRRSFLAAGTTGALALGARCALGQDPNKEKEPVHVFESFDGRIIEARPKLVEAEIVPVVQKALQQVLIMHSGGYAGSSFALRDPRTPKRDGAKCKQKHMCIATARHVIQSHLDAKVPLVVTIPSTGRHVALNPLKVLVNATDAAIVIIDRKDGDELPQEGIPLQDPRDLLQPDEQVALLGIPKRGSKVTASHLTVKEPVYVEGKGAEHGVMTELSGRVDGGVSGGPAIRFTLSEGAEGQRIIQYSAIGASSMNIGSPETARQAVVHAGEFYFLLTGKDQGPMHIGSAVHTADRKRRDMPVWKPKEEEGPVLVAPAN